MKGTLLLIGYIVVLGGLAFGTLWGARLYFYVWQSLKRDTAKIMLFLGFLGCFFVFPMWLLSCLFDVYKNYIGSFVRTASFIGWLSPALFFMLTKPFLQTNK